MNTRHAATRRQILRTFGAAALSAALLGGAAATAEAGRSWCRRDPVIKIDGKVADIWLTGAGELDEVATGPTRIVVGVPTGMSTQLLASDLGFNKLGYAVSFVEDPALSWGESGAQVTVRVFVPASLDGLEVQVNFAPRSLDLPAASASGVSNSWISLSV